MKRTLAAAGIVACLATGVAQARFVSTDPVKANPNNGQNFNRYQYGNNNPYKFIDPDGRRSVVKDGQIHITPEDRSVPAIAPIPNNVGAVGVSPSDGSFHQYNVTTPSGLSPQQAGDGFRFNPTPGQDMPASPGGTRNNVGDIPIMDGANYVRSFAVASPDPARFTDVTVNYTVAGEHKLAEGFVMRYGEINPNGGVTLRSYGEGNSWRQNPVLSPVWNPQVQQVWQQNHQEIISTMSGR
ncbi:TPA: hypothetical protein UOJ00_002974 [Stenotrophomonas maltophilia]|nr:hypothetical protein [Stenotrophomonas maltophilia]